MFKTMFFAMYFLNPNSVPQIETQLFDSPEECSAYMEEVHRELKFWRDNGGKVDRSKITWRMGCKSLNLKRDVETR